MNERGVFFIIIILYLILSLTALHSVRELDQAERNQQPEATFTERVHSRFNNIHRTIIDLDKSTINHDFDQRLVPFQYERSPTTFDFNQYLPGKEGALETYLDAVNIYRVFVTDQNFDNIYDGIETSLETPRPANWGGNATGIGFLINPPCFEYRQNDNNTLQLRPITNPQCAIASPDINFLRVDINIIADSASEDWNTTTCAPGPCIQNAFNPTDTRPYYHIQFNTTVCALCSIAPAVYSGHFDLNENHIITVSNPSPGAASKPIVVTINEGLTIAHADSKSMLVKAKLSFREPIRDILVADINLDVRMRDFNLIARNTPIP